MQPIVLLGVAVAAVALVSTGFLNDNMSWNEFELWVQQLGWGEDRLTSPISMAHVDLEIKKIVNDAGTDPADCDEQTQEEQDECIKAANWDDYFDNVIQSCSFHGDKDINLPPASTSTNEVTVLNDGIIICKMLNEDGNAIAEGKRTIVEMGGYTASDKEIIHINQCITENGLVSVPFPDPANCLDVQTPIHFVKLVVEDPIWADTAIDEE